MGWEKVGILYKNLVRKIWKSCVRLAEKSVLSVKETWLARVAGSGYSLVEASWNAMTRAETRLRLSAKRNSPFNRLKPNDPYMGRTAPLTSKCCILYIYSTNTGTEYFKHALYSPFFLSKMQLFRNANLFGCCIIHILYTECAKIKKKNNSGAKGLNISAFCHMKCIYAFSMIRT